MAPLSISISILNLFCLIYPVRMLTHTSFLILSFSELIIPVSIPDPMCKGISDFQLQPSVLCWIVSPLKSMTFLEPQNVAWFGVNSLQKQLIHMRLYWSRVGPKSNMSQRHTEGKQPFNSRGKIEKIPYRRKWQPTPVFLPGKPHGQEEPGTLQSMGSWRVGHDLATEHTRLQVKECQELLATTRRWERNMEQILPEPPRTNQPSWHFSNF